MLEERRQALTYVMWLDETATKHERDTGHTVQWHYDPVHWTCAGTHPDGTVCRASSETWGVK